jgi:hypothetical protein
VRSMKALLSFLFRRRPARQTSVAFGTGIVAVALSAAMIPLDRWPLAVILVRDIGQMFLVGFLFPLIYIRRSDADFASFGLTMRRWHLFLPINIGLAALLYLKLMSSSPPPPGFQLDALALWNAGYVMVALSFELLFFYAFLRTLFEWAFGPVVAGRPGGAVLFTAPHRISAGIRQAVPGWLALRDRLPARQQCAVDLSFLPGRWRHS